jgi:hypothetical protein
MAMQNPTLIFIPDISGFTEFVNQTAIEHSQHIISELLEIIIDANLLSLKISEIEGDAVLFYKDDTIPKIGEVFNQAKEMFLRFHSYLSEMEATNVCQCGACKTASNLTLKFITHIGETKQVLVKSFKKIIGSDLILAHRLLKNSIPSSEYLLITDKYLNNSSEDINNLESWVKVENSTEDFENFGIVSSKFIDFNPLRTNLAGFKENIKPAQYDKKPDIQVNIDAPILLVHHSLTSADAKYDYVPGIKKIVKDSKINKVNSSHICVFDNLEIHFITKSNYVNKNSIRYSEEAKLTKGFNFITDYKLSDINGMTELSVYINKIALSGSETSSFFTDIKDFVFLKFLIFNTRKGMKSFKNYCEKLNKDETWK